MKTPAEIIKGIECCHLQPISNCSACPYGKYDTRGTCAILLAQDAHDIIPELTKENEKLRAELDERKLIIAKRKEGLKNE
jgi:hypothetical protein